MTCHTNRTALLRTVLCTADSCQSWLRLEALGFCFVSLLGAAANTATLSTSDAGQLTVSEEATGAALTAALGADLGVEICALLFFVGLSGALAAGNGTCHRVIPPGHTLAIIGIIHASERPVSRALSRPAIPYKMKTEGPPANWQTLWFLIGITLMIA